jgi:hypothetical protein
MLRGEGDGPSKQAGQQKAAEAALSYYQNNPNAEMNPNTH